MNQNLPNPIKIVNKNLLESMNNEYQLAQLCEIAYIVGRLEGDGKLEPQDLDLEEMYCTVYKPIYDEWQNPEENTFKDDEERGYISAFAQRKLLEYDEYLKNNRGDE